MKDNFSNHASAYARFRPSYPEEVFTAILAQVPDRSTAWDCGTGNGQVAVRLAEEFGQVYATDISQKQMDQAPPRENITYQVVAAEDASFPDHSLDLITVAQAIHWFDFERFYAVVDGALKTQGILALLGYTLLTIDPKLDEVIYRLYEGILGNYWDPERRYVEAKYQTIPFPYQELPAPEVDFTLEWSYEQLVGYLNTWSAAQHYQRAQGYNPVALIEEDLKEAWQEADKKTVRFPIIIRLGRK